MAQEPSELRRIDWSECFAFTQLFRTFRVAIQPSKLILALAAIVCIGVWGGILDGVWSQFHQPLEGELNAHWQTGVDSWRDKEMEWQASEFERLCAKMDALAAEVGMELHGDESGAETGDGDESADAGDEDVPTPRKAFMDDPSKAIAEAREDLAGLHEKATEDKDADTYKGRVAIARVAAKCNELNAELGKLGPKGIFRSFRHYETSVVRQMIDAARGLNFTGQLSEVVNARANGPGYVESDEVSPAVARMVEQLVANSPELAGMMDRDYAAGQPGVLPTVRTGPDGIGVLACIVLAVRGVQWMLIEHPWFSLLFLLDALAIWALFGGAICRMAALNFARDERISAGAALGFAWQKFLGLFVAPLLPIGLVVLIGIGIVVGGVLLSVPGLDVLAGLGLGLSLAGGFIAALVMVGGLGAGALMWPTIAVEGSDAFDAMSRGYNYVYGRPWRTALYAGVTLVYGAICYLVVRLLAVVMLKVTRLFLGVGLMGNPRPGTGSASADKLDAIWPHPSYEVLVPPTPVFGLDGATDGIVRFLIVVWSLLVAGLLCGFLASFFFSGSTMMYYLLRREVDAIDLEDVYVAETEDEDFLAEYEAAPEPTPAESPKQDDRDDSPGDNDEEPEQA